jgi:hypothetical protein
VEGVVGLERAPQLPAGRVRLEAALIEAGETAKHRRLLVGFERPQHLGCRLEERHQKVLRQRRHRGPPRWARHVAASLPGHRDRQSAAPGPGP